MNLADLAPIAALIPIVVGLVQMIRGAAALPDRVLPLVSLVTAVALTFLVAVGGGDAFSASAIATYLVQGIVTGLGASGAYSSARTLAGG